MAEEAKQESTRARFGMVVYLLLVSGGILVLMFWGATTIPQSVRDGVTLDSSEYHEVTGSLDRRLSSGARHQTSYWSLRTAEGPTEEMVTLRNTSLRKYVDHQVTGYVDRTGRLLAIEPRDGLVVRAVQVGKESIALRFLVALSGVVIASSMLTHAFRRRGKPWVDWRLATAIVVAFPLSGLIWAHVQDLDAMLLADRVIVPFALGTAAFLGALAWAFHLIRASTPKRKQS